MKLCEAVVVGFGSAQVKPGGTAGFAIWMSSWGADTSGVTVTLATKPKSAIPHFALCPTSHATTTCKIATLFDGHPFEVAATVAVPTSSTNGEHVTLTAKVASTTPANAVSASATVTVAVPVTSTAQNGLAGAAGQAGSSSPGLSSSSLPLVTGGAVASRIGNSNIGALLPSVPAVTPSPAAGQAQSGGAVSSAQALDRRLLGTQLIALAALCAAVGIVISRLTFRQWLTPGAAKASSGSAGGSAGAATAAAAGVPPAVKDSTAAGTPTPGEAGKPTPGEASTPTPGEAHGEAGISTKNVQDPKATGSTSDAPPRGPKDD